MNDEQSTINHKIGEPPPIAAPDAVVDGAAHMAEARALSPFATIVYVRRS